MFKNPIIIFLLCSGIAGFGLYCLLRTHMWWFDIGCYIVPVFGLGAIVLPIIMAIREK